MATDNPSKLKKLLVAHIPGTLCVASWLETLDISRDLQRHYRRSGWLETAGRGAFKRPGDEVAWQGGLYALQTQSRLAVHAGALTALAVQGYAHYLRFGEETVFLFAPPRTNLPAWFLQYEWGASLSCSRTSILPDKLGLIAFRMPLFSIQVSTPERAILECLYLSPDKIDLVECYQIMQGLTTLRPRLLQQLLEQCSSIKIKRLFLYMADKAGHAWFKRLNTSGLELGKGDRSIAPGGVYIAQFGITVPQELAKL